MEGDGKGYLFIAGVNISDIFFDESGQFLHIQQGEQKVQIPVEDAAGRLELKGELLIVYDETGFPQAVFDAEDPEAGWNFVDPNAKGEIVAMFDKHGFDFGSLDFAFEDGLIRGYDPESGEMVFEDGKFDLRWAVEHLPTENLKETKFKPIRGHAVPEDAIYWEFFKPIGDKIIQMIKESGDERDLAGHGLILLDPAKNAWGHVIKEAPLFTGDETHERYLAYEDDLDNIHWFEIIDMNLDDYIKLVKERGKLAYEDK